MICRAYEGSFADPEFKEGSSFAPFTESKLEEIAATDLKVGRQCSSPTLVSPTLEKLCDQFWGSAILLEQTSEEPTSIEAPMVEGPAPAMESNMAEGSPRALEEVASIEAYPPYQSTLNFVIELCRIMFDVIVFLNPSFFLLRLF